MNEIPSKRAMAITWLSGSIFSAMIFSLFEYIGSYRTCAPSQVFSDCMPGAMYFVNVFIRATILMGIVLLPYIILRYYMIKKEVKRND